MVILYMWGGVVTASAQEPDTVQSVQTDDVSTEDAPVDTFVDEALKNPKNYRDFATLRSLNKITATISLLEIEKDKASHFGNLMITLRKCWQSPPEMEPESKALLEIWEEVPGEKAELLFNGWMFASSPSISALEHPVYDITLISCNKD